MHKRITSTGATEAHFGVQCLNWSTHFQLESTEIKIIIIIHFQLEITEIKIIITHFQLESTVCAT